MFARIGGEEFVILMPGLDRDAATKAAEDVRSAVEQMSVPLPAGQLWYTVSIGVATLDAADENFPAMLARADAALYEAKGAGRNRVMTAPTMH
jgi:diguanylate cyclase (GGDEF)-like protein